jgi:Glu-tRNA(Gln) amidotransferase subunit E-like FAD-binding protein
MGLTAIKRADQCAKEDFVPKVAEQFQRAIKKTALINPRSLTNIDGDPRDDIDPLKQVSDYSDALGFLRTVLIVETGAIATGKGNV